MRNFFRQQNKAPVDDGHGDGDGAHGDRQRRWPAIEVLMAMAPMVIGMVANKTRRWARLAMALAMARAAIGAAVVAAQAVQM